MKTVGVRGRWAALAAAAACAAAAGPGCGGDGAPRAAVTATLRISVEPAAQTDLVLAQLRSARFKYEAGAKAGAPPALAQRLTAAGTGPGAVEARVGLRDRAEAQRYAGEFAAVLQARCGARARVQLAGHSIE